MMAVRIQSLFFTLAIIIIYITNSESCIRSYSGHIIDYISNNIAIDPSIHNLGIKTSSTQCQHSCINFNYLCNASTDVIYGGTGDWHLDDATCELTAHAPTSSGFSWIAPITHDLFATEYSIEMQLTLTSGVIAGVFWKATYDEAGRWLRDFHFGLDAKDSTPVVGFSDPNFTVLKKETLASNPGYDTRHNLTVYYNYGAFTAYFNGEPFYSGSIDTSSYTNDYIAVYNYADAIFHSLYIRFPNTKDEMFCSAFVYNKDDGSCHGYYGDDYIAIETSLATQSAYDAGIRYDSVTCSVETTTSEPTASPLATSAPSESITSEATLSPTESVSPLPTSSPLTTPPVSFTLEPTLSIMATLSSITFTTEAQVNEREVADDVMTTGKDEINSKPKASPSDRIYLIVIGLVLLMIFVVFIAVYNYFKCKHYLNSNAKQKAAIIISNETKPSQPGADSMQVEQAQSDSDHEQKPELKITSGETNWNNVVNADAVMKGSALMTKGGAIKGKVVKINDEVNSDEDDDDDLWNNDTTEGEQETNSSK